MSNKKLLIIFLSIFVISLLILIHKRIKSFTPSLKTKTPANQPTPGHPLAIKTLQARAYPPSKIIIEETLPPTPNYYQYIASYTSDGLKIYALLTTPIGDKPQSGWPAIIFNHGYIPPEIYRTNERYGDYVAAFTNQGYIVFKPDFRGHGFSEGEPEGAYYSPAYTIDSLNALAAIKNYQNVNPNKIGVWGHSMGGNIVLRSIVVNQKDIKAAVIWAGVVGSYSELMNNWRRSVPYQPSPRELSLRNRNRQQLIDKHGTPQSNPNFWNTIDPTNFLAEITTPIQLHHGTSDEEVPYTFSQSLYDRLKATGKTVEFYLYENGDHNLSSPAFELAIQRTLNFFDKYLK